jgi:hypothetical protein
VDYLGLDSVPLARRPTVSGVPVFAPKPAGEPVLKEDGQAFEARYFTDWSNAILRIAEENTIAAMGGQVDSAQNTKLGRILEVLRGG